MGKEQKILQVETKSMKVAGISTRNMAKVLFIWIKKRRLNYMKVCIIKVLRKARVSFTVMA